MVNIKTIRDLSTEWRTMNITIRMMVVIGITTKDQGFNDESSRLGVNK